MWERPGRNSVQMGTQAKTSKWCRPTFFPGQKICIPFARAYDILLEIKRTYWALIWNEICFYTIQKNKKERACF